MTRFNKDRGTPTRGDAPGERAELERVQFAVDREATREEAVAGITRQLMAKLTGREPPEETHDQENTS